jgi:dTMP kinase
MILNNFAVIEGCDGSGTTTQLKLLEKAFVTEKHANPVFYATNEPTQGQIGLLIRRILKGEIPAEKETIARLFAADRNEHLYAAGGIAERCARGELVVSDRYTPSSLVYQGLECGRELPLALNAAFPHPELLIYLDIESEAAMGRIGNREEKREIYEHGEFQAKVRSAYLELLPFYEKSGVRVLRLDGTREPSVLADEIWSAVCKMPIMNR